MNLNVIGWKKYDENIALPESDFAVGRVAIENKTNFTLITEDGEREGILRGKTLTGFDEQGFPKVGDWVRISKLGGENKVVIEEVLPRYSKISRKSPQDRVEQVIVANIDFVFIVQGLPDDFSLRRLERYLVIAKQSGARPIVILNKVDLKDEYFELLAEAKTVAQDVPVIGVSAKTSQGVDELVAILEPGSTFVFLGSSGVGKSSLINILVGNEKQGTSEIRDYDQRGRHKTTKREMIVLEDGSILIDTPGMRELSLWADEEDLEKAFEDVEQIAYNCKFTDCDHEKSDGCAVRQALEDGTLNLERYNSYLKLKREAEYLASKSSKKKQLERKIEFKKRHKSLRKKLKNKYA